MNYVKNAEFKFENTCVAFGCFDGVHVGHRAVVAKLLEEKALTGVVVALEPGGKVLSTPREKEYLMEKLGVENMVSLPASAMGCPKAFVEEVLIGKLGAKKVVVGEGFTFGADNSGDAALLRELGLEVVVVDEVKLNGEAVSKESVVKAFEADDFKTASEMLGGHYLFCGPVTHGKAAGRKHGMPTANLGFGQEKILPPLGVYGCVSRVEDKVNQGMTNIGRRPSDDDMDYISVETFLLDFSGDIYDKEQILEVYIYIRGVKKFSGGLDEVRRQIDKDILAIKDFMTTIL